MIQIDYFNDKEYDFIHIWEHEYHTLRKEPGPLQTYHSIRYPHYKRLEYYGHLNIRDAFFGGRTNNIFFSYECGEGEVIRYLDVTSLYPSVLVKNPYPMGHPLVITEFQTTDISEYFGFVKCKILPPKDLFLPVLPYRDSNKKLLFPLCHLCAEVKASECNHSNEDREFVGTWFTEELKLALTKGYQIIRLYEVLHYEQSSAELFQPYIRSWLKLKTEASGWPSSCDTEEKKQDFLRNFKQREGIKQISILLHLFILFYLQM